MTVTEAKRDLHRRRCCGRSAGDRPGRPTYSSATAVYTKAASASTTRWAAGPHHGRAAAASPGHRTAAGRRMDSIGARDCFGCHSTGGIRGAGCIWKRSSPGVGCESCHGPGGEARGGDARRRTRRPPRCRSWPSSAAEEMSELCGQLPPDLVADCAERPARRAQRPLPAVPAGEQQMLRRGRRAHPLHGLPRSARRSGDKRGKLRCASARPAMRRRSGRKICRVGESELRGLPYAQDRIARRARALHGSPDPHRPSRMSRTRIENMRRSAKIDRRRFLAAREPPAWHCCREGTAADARPLFEEIPARGQRHSLGARQRRLGRTLPARDDGPGLRFPGLRQRRLDGHFPGEQRPVRFLQAEEADSQRALQEQSRRHVHRRDRSRPACRAAASAWAWRPGITTTTVSRTSFVTAYGRPILYHNNGDGTFTDVSEKAGLGAKVFEDHWTHERGLVRLRQ